MHIHFNQLLTHPPVALNSKSETAHRKCVGVTFSHFFLAVVVLPKLVLGRHFTGSQGTEETGVVLCGRPLLTIQTWGSLACCLDDWLQTFFFLSFIVC